MNDKMERLNSKLFKPLTLKESKQLVGGARTFKFTNTGGSWDTLPDDHIDP